MQTILITTMIVSAFTGVLALMLTIANRTIANYGEQKITINDDKEYIVQGGNSLLSSLIEQKIFIPSACGGRGTCGYCKVKVLEGGGPILPTELPWLTKEEVNNNVRLSCQCKVKENIRIQIPEELFNVREYEATVELIEDMTPEIKRLRLKLNGGEELNFKPGQYIQFKIPTYEGNDEEIYRAYSIANSPQIKGYVDLYIGYTGGIATTYIHKFLKNGERVNINGPYGDFYYHDETDREMILVAVATGIAPILSILQHMKENDIKRKATFYFGAKTPEDLFELDLIKELEEELYDFKFVPTLSRVKEEHNWTGDKGRVNVALENHIVNSDNKEAYLCGSPGMIDSVVEVLKSKGFTDDRIYYDKF